MLNVVPAIIKIRYEMYYFLIIFCTLIQLILE